MDFVDQLKQFSKRVETLKDTIQTEEATKTAIIMPFFAMLGYDVFNPQEFVPEFTADVGIKKGEKVDYAIMQDGQPVILIECKPISEDLSKHSSQLFRYFSTTAAKFAILTNGQFYRFYTDLDDQNKMDKDPFLVINILEIRENQVPELKKFCKSEFDVSSIFSAASELKYVHEFKTVFSNFLLEPSDDFVRLFLQRCWSGQKTQNVIDKFKPILKKALNDQVSELMNDKIKSALGGSGGSISIASSEVKKTSDEPQPEDESNELKKQRTPNIVTTEEELEAYFIVKNMLSSIIDMHDITYRDTESYINILYKGNGRKWICRLRLTDTQKTLIIPDGNKKEMKYKLEDIYSLKKYQVELETVLKRYI